MEKDVLRTEDGFIAVNEQGRPDISDSFVREGDYRKEKLARGWHWEAVTRITVKRTEQ